MRHRLLALTLTTLLAGCGGPQTPPPPAIGTATAPASDANAAFAALSRQAVDDWMRLSPVAATQAGDHRFDAELDDLSAAGRQRRVDTSKAL
ncbi:MAG: DUF885 domain-containing protein, partial [Thermomonas sp.]